jgi:hypothetical protein
MENQKPEKKKSQPNSLANYIAGAVFNGVFIFLVNKIPDWNLAFISDGYSQVLWALNLSLIAQTAGNLVLIFYHPLLVHHIGNLLFSVLGFIAIVVLYTVFPFNLADSQNWLRILLRVVMIVGMVGTAIAFVVHIVGCIRAVVMRDETT